MMARLLSALKTRITSGCSKRLPSKAAANEEAKRILSHPAHPELLLAAWARWYVEPLRFTPVNAAEMVRRQCPVRTPLADFFSILLRWRSTVMLGLCIGLLAFPMGCAAERDGHLRSVADEGWQPWQILETETNRVIPFSELMTNLKGYDIIYLGEEHHNPYHIQAALKVLDQLVADGIEPTIGMEMFGWDGQPALDDYVATPPSVTKDFSEEVRWKQNWGGAFEDYAPLVRFARDRHLSVLAMNPPKPLIRRVVKVGLEQARQEPEWASWGILQEDIVDDPAYRERIVDQLRRCHGGTEEHYQTMYEASMVRDEGMARTLAIRQEELLRENGGSRHMIVSYTGGGHVQYNLPVPKRVARRLRGDIKQATIYMMSFEPGKTADVRALMQEPIADYIWLTPMGKSSSSKPCR